MFAITLATLVLEATVPTVSAKKADDKYSWETAPKPSLVEFEGHEMSIDVGHELRATAGACTWSVMMNPDDDLCPDSEEIDTWTDYAAVEMSEFGGEILLSPGILAANASSEQSRKNCGSATATAIANSTAEHVALATGSGMVAFSMINGKQSSESWDSDGIDIANDCLTGAGASTGHETLTWVITEIPFTLTEEALVTGSVEHSEIAGGSGEAGHELTIEASLGGESCELESDEVGMPQNCRMKLLLGPGTYTLRSKVKLKAWTVSDSDSEPSSSVSYIDYVGATIAAQRL